MLKHIPRLEDNIIGPNASGRAYWINKSDEHGQHEVASESLAGGCPKELNSPEQELELELGPDHEPLQRSAPVISRKRRFALKRKTDHFRSSSPQSLDSSELSALARDGVPTPALVSVSAVSLILAPLPAEPRQTSPTQADLQASSVVDFSSSSSQPEEPSSTKSPPGSLSLPMDLSALLGTTELQNFSHKPPPAKQGDNGSYDRKHSTVDFFRRSFDLDQENAHFVVVDIVIELLEEIKWSLCERCSTSSTHIPQERNSTHSCFNEVSSSLTSFDSGYEECCADKEPSIRSSASLPQCAPLYPMMPCSAEGLAQRLVAEIRKQWFTPVDKHCYHDNLSPTEQELGLDPFSMGMWDKVNSSDEIRQKSRMRGTLTWDPPRFQIIFHVHPAHRRSEVVASQHFLCAGCGTPIEQRHIKRLRYCHYLGRYFCKGCHGGGESVIPGRVLTRWDFRCYPVCHFSRQLLDLVWEQPLFKLTSLAQALYGRARELVRFRELQELLTAVKKLLSACRLSKGALAEFDQLPAHLTQELHHFSMDDLVRLKRGQLVAIAKAVLRSATAHVESCELCQARGFICEFCRGKEVLFPFQRDICVRCQDCKACFHRSCYRGEECPKCVRLNARKTHQDAVGC